MTVIKAAAVQLSPVLYSREGTVEKVCRQIIALGRQGVQFATFPETVVPYYPYFSASSAESVGAFRLREVAKVVQESQSGHFGRSESVRLSRHQFRLVVEPLHGPR